MYTYDAAGEPLALQSDRLHLRRSAQTFCTQDGGAKVAFNLRFPGQYHDAETGKHYNYFRDYDPSLGRYLQSDPVGLRGGANTFGYVRGRPTTRVDPLGLYEFDSSCFNCKNDLEEWRRQIDNACKVARAEVKDPALSECIQKRCESAKVKCDGPSCGNRSYSGYELGGEVHLCASNQNNFRNDKKPNLGCTAIHEFAHSCKWQHRDMGVGVPGQGTSAKPDEGWIDPIECAIKWMAR